MNIKTHKKINSKLCGNVKSLKNNYSLIELQTTLEMVADEHGLIHGGFIFSAADYAAMLAVNDPHVVLGSSESKFLKPVKLHDTVLLEAKVIESYNKKRIITVEAKVSEKLVLVSTLTCFVLDKHIFS